MKVAKWIAIGLAILSGAACLFLYLGPVIIGRLLSYDIKDAGAIGIIGGADGPTSIFVASRAHSALRPVLPIVFALSLFSGILLTLKGKKRDS